MVHCPSGSKTSENNESGAVLREMKGYDERNLEKLRPTEQEQLDLNMLDF